MTSTRVTGEGCEMVPRLRYTRHSRSETSRLRWERKLVNLAWYLKEAESIRRQSRFEQVVSQSNASKHTKSPYKLHLRRASTSKLARKRGLVEP